MQVFGYIRVSTEGQNDDRQRIAMEPFNIKARNIYADKCSGKSFDRPAYKRLIKKIRPSDILIIKSIDRLGRNYKEIIDEWRFLTREKNIDIKVLDMPLLDTTYCKDLLGSFISDLVLQVLSFTAQIERDTLLERQKEGIAVAKAKGVAFGRPPMSMPDNFFAIYRRWQNGEINKVEASVLCGCSVRTLYEKTAHWRENNF